MSRQLIKMKAEKTNTFEKVRNTVFVVIFLLVSTLNFWVPALGIKDAESVEIKPIPIQPAFSWMYRRTFSGEFENYFVNSFAIRHRLLRTDRQMRVELFGEHYFDGVYIGEDNWLFLNNLKTSRDCQNVGSFPKHELKRQLRILKQVDQYLEEEGVEFVLAVTPSKCKIYPEHSQPWAPEFSEGSRVDQYIAYFEENSDIPVIDFRPALLEAKQEHQVYFKTDPHWNYYGIYAGYKEIVRALLPDVREDEFIPLSITRSEITPNWKGSLGRFLGFSDTYTEDYERLYFETEAEIWTAKEDIFVVDNPNATHDMTVIIFHDSFYEYDFPKHLLAAHFKRVIYYSLNHGWVWEPRVGAVADLVRIWGPDVIIVQRVERIFDDFGTRY
jgi:hypothetical protein